ncbi:hypothetical protein [Streptomyces sp. CB03238]|uniref:hypothetical protein n=1 Tax=Streptomyces sp. CB03238 TaxID=1907777 RepID=UPI00117DE210|nr:hypothetical protein [Streptomyces sp. CB03238]
MAHTDDPETSKTSEPAWGTPEYHLRGLKRVVSTISNDTPGAAAFLSATVAFTGDGDQVKEADVFQKAADYFRQHPELAVHAANWTTFLNENGLVRYQLELSVAPPAYIDPEHARDLYPRAEQ